MPYIKLRLLNTSTQNYIAQCHSGCNSRTIYVLKNVLKDILYSFNQIELNLYHIFINL